MGLKDNGFSMYNNTRREFDGLKKMKQSTHCNKINQIRSLFSCIYIYDCTHYSQQN